MDGELEDVLREPLNLAKRKTCRIRSWSEPRSL